VIRISFDTSDYSKYPLLNESHEFISLHVLDIGIFLSSVNGLRALNHAHQIIRCLIDNKIKTEEGISVIQTGSDLNDAIVSVSAYALTRIIVSCLSDKRVINAAINFYTDKIYEDYIHDTKENRANVANSLGVPFGVSLLPVSTYIKLTSKIKGESWRIINRRVLKGKTNITPEEINEIVKERIRDNISENMPLKIPDKVSTYFTPVLTQLRELINSNLPARNIIRSYGIINEIGFPPCMRKILHSIVLGIDLSHTDRFTFTSFLHAIGIPNTKIVEIYSTSANFDLQKTMYQVDHISGGSVESAGYNCPSCATMWKNSSCVCPDVLCRIVLSPVIYYSRKLQLMQKQ
jgi:DNA primase large subunit